MSVSEHRYPIPDERELAQMVGAATPHFALQIRDRVQALADSLPPDHLRHGELRGHIEDLERLAVDGEVGRAGQAELPPRPSLTLGSGSPGDRSG